MHSSVKVIFIFLAIIPIIAFGQVNNTTNGTSTPNLKTDLSNGVIESQANNELLYQQALQNPSSAPGAVIKPNGDSAMIATPDGPSKSVLNLTDAEKRLSEDFVHDGKALREQEAACAKLDDPRACSGSDPKSKFMGIDSGMVKALSKAYTMVVGMMDTGMAMRPGKKDVSDDGAIKPVTEGDGTKVTNSSKTVDGKVTKTKTVTSKDGSLSTKTTTDANGKESVETTKEDKKKDQKDYCKYIAVGTEAVAMFQTQMTSKNAAIPSNQDTAQKDILYKAARTHKDRAKSHKLQYVGWGATTGCYAYMLSPLGGAALDVTNILKFVSSGVMTAFFVDQANLNEQYYKDVKGIADSLPGKGDCNPITDKDCYCSQEETMNDPQVCLPQLHGNNVKLGNYRVACIDGNGKVDPKCTCIDADACLNNRVMNKLKPFGFGTAFNSAALKPLNNISRGQLTAEDLASASNGALKAFNRRIMEKINPNVPNSGALTSAQQKNVKDLSAMGITPKLAAFLAKQKISPQMKSGMARFSNGYRGGRSASKYRPRRKRGNVLNFGGGNGINKKSRKKSSSNPYAKFMNRGKKGKGSRKGKVLNYENRALQSAQINKDKDRPIFEIISRRYQVSGFKRLEINR